MRINLALVLSLLFGVALVALGFTAFQVSADRERLTSDLESRTVQVAEVFYKSHFTNLRKEDSLHFRHITDSLINQYRFTGLAVFYNPDSLRAINPAVEPFLRGSHDFVARTIAADSSQGQIVSVRGKNNMNTCGW